MTVDNETEYRLETDSELRFEVEDVAPSVELRLTSGKAEVFGMELSANRTYKFPPGSKAAVYTWHGCTVKLKGKTEGTYKASETPMVQYFNCHACLERMRYDSVDGLTEEEFPKGPIAMVVGANDVGKSTLCQMLLNYAVRQFRRPIFVDVDVDQGSISVPGTIGAALIERPVSVEAGYSQEAPLVFQYGQTLPSKNTTLHNILISRLATAVHNKMASNKKIGASGVIINTSGWIKGDGYKCLMHIAQAFEVDVILVLDNERLYNELGRDIPFIKVVALPKSGGVVDRTDEMKTYLRDERIKQYFYGQKVKFHPHMFEVKYSHLQIYKIGCAVLNDDLLPSDMKVDDPMSKIVPIEPGPRLKHHLLSLSHALTVDDLLTSNVSGFICVLDVDDERKTITVLSPQPKPLPKCMLLQMDVIFMDAS